LQREGFAARTVRIVNNQGSKASDLVEQFCAEKRQKSRTPKASPGWAVILLRRVPDPENVLLENQKVLPMS
jgi:hypothetical protein